MEERAAAWEVSADEAGQRLDRWLAERLGLSRAQTRRLLARGAVRSGSRVLDERAKGLALRAGERVEVRGALRPEEQAPPAEPDTPLAVLAEGPGWLAVDKPAGVPVHPLEPDERGTLLGAALARHPELLGVGEGGLRSGVVHRLDVDTSGALLLATAEPTWQRLRGAFRERRVRKVYRAIALGRVEHDAALELPLVVARRSPATVRCARPDERHRARLTRTSWRVLEPLRGATLLEVRARTGFLHQVRATLAHLGHPLAGDRLYGPAGRAPLGDASLRAPEALADDPTGARRHMLHAARVAFEEIEAESPEPEDFAALRRALRGI